MKIPVETKPALWGFAAGAVSLAVVGFAWAGWMTGGDAEAAASARADAAVVSTLSPICVAKFRSGAEMSSRVTAFKQLDSWAQAEFIEKGGWAAGGDAASTSLQTSVARACAETLASS